VVRVCGDAPGAQLDQRVGSADLQWGTPGSFIEVVGEVGDLLRHARERALDDGALVGRQLCIELEAHAVVRVAHAQEPLGLGRSRLVSLSATFEVASMPDRAPDDRRVDALRP